eukprot:TRINITY_DN1239_c0_g2_i1.p1 TRINITY_DN1239_c0_g2~~TRINITY_DN1239_c0_g2_i1.p1  ORF type:complete len:285 (+),score=41.16 TRINITY_DN1239_c0_g2_i1:61-915(+)
MAMRGLLSGAFSASLASSLGARLGFRNSVRSFFSSSVLRSEEKPIGSISEPLEVTEFRRAQPPRPRVNKVKLRKELENNFKSTQKRIFKETEKSAEARSQSAPAVVQISHSIPPEQEPVLAQFSSREVTVDPKDLKFAVISVGGKQWKVCKDDLISPHRINETDIGTQMEFVPLLVGSREYTTIGRPFVPNAKVIGVIEEHTQSGKIIIFKKKRRKNYRRTNGHRQLLTVLRITDIIHDPSTNPTYPLSESPALPEPFVILPNKPAVTQAASIGSSSTSSTSQS